MFKVKCVVLLISRFRKCKKYGSFNQEEIEFFIDDITIIFSEKSYNRLIPLL